MKTNEIHFVMIGGFLGAGKTTSVIRFARWLKDHGMNAGVITNDQAAGLVDTTLTRSSGVITEEIAGGCFCCKSDSLIQATEALLQKGALDVLIAEPVGSCTDLIATVALPLRTVYQKAYRIAPLSVVVDPFRAQRVMAAAEKLPSITPEAGGFSEDVNYIYLKQLEEAEIIVINKCDLLPGEKLAALKQRLGAAFPEALILTTSARDGSPADEWWRLLLEREHQPRALATIDYQRYAEGEAQLGWLNASLVVDAKDRQIDADRVLAELASNLAARLRASGKEVAHLKITFQPRGFATEQISVVQWSRSDGEPEPTRRLSVPVSAGEITVNLRAEASPEDLRSALEEAQREVLRALLQQTPTVTCFRPAPPRPLHRLGAEGASRR